MDRLFRPSRIRQEPLISICWIIAIMTIVGGIYILSPWLVITNPTGASALFSTAASTAGLVALAAVAFASGAMTIYGIVKNKASWIRRGIGTNLLIRFYAFLVSLLVYGLESSYMSSITIMGIMLVVYLALGKARVKP